jgi:hypothetical protein
MCAQGAGLTLSNYDGRGKYCRSLLHALLLSHAPGAAIGEWSKPILRSMGSGAICTMDTSSKTIDFPLTIKRGAKRRNASLEKTFD